MPDDSQRIFLYPEGIHPSLTEGRYKLSGDDLTWLLKPVELYGEKPKRNHPIPLTKIVRALRKYWGHEIDTDTPLYDDNGKWHCVFVHIFGSEPCDPATTKPLLESYATPTPPPSGSLDPRWDVLFDPHTEAYNALRIIQRMSEPVSERMQRRAKKRARKSVDR